MDGNNQPSSSSSKSSPVLKIIIIVGAIVIGVLIAGVFFNKTKIDQLTDSLKETQEQVKDVKEETTESKQNVADEARQGLQNIEGSIQDIDNPVARLALAKAYVAALRPYLTQSDRADLDTVVVYVEKNPNVLVVDNPQLPQNVQTAVTNLKAKAANLRNAAVVTAQKVDDATFSPNEVVTLTGTIQFVEDDDVFGGSIFTLTDSETGSIYYLHFNDTNSATIKNTMNGKMVTVEVKVTSSVGQPLTFQVLKGPTLVTQTNPTQPAAATSTPTTQP